ncbi:TrbI/VirB10 family protein [Bradyrhizobium pachyrhizi]|uniref:TrbI/VirB10 family protein n=1 Tax=Bradyrhizobium pachyrhizi TaxID=280333 RepID=UPI00067D17F6
MPNSNSIVIENLPATDVAGYAGLEDEVDFHTWQLLKGVALATLIGVANDAAHGNDLSWIRLEVFNELVELILRWPPVSLV